MHNISTNMFPFLHHEWVCYVQSSRVSRGWRGVSTVLDDPFSHLRGHTKVSHEEVFSLRSRKTVVDLGGIHPEL